MTQKPVDEILLAHMQREKAAREAAEKKVKKLKKRSREDRGPNSDVAGRARSPRAREARP